MKALEWIVIVPVLVVGFFLAPELVVPGVIGWALYKLNKM